MNLVVHNIGKEPIEFNFKPYGNQLVQLPEGSSAYLTSTLQGTQLPEPVDITFREGQGSPQNTFSISVDWKENAQNQTLNLGNGEANLIASGGNSGGSGSMGGTGTMTTMGGGNETMTGSMGGHLVPLGKPIGLVE